MPKAEKEEAKQTSRAFWSGTITFGLVSVPVNLFPAVRSGGVHFRMLDQDGTPLRRQYFGPKEDRPVGPDELVRGYEIAPDEYVVVTDEELESLEPRKSHDIDLRAFVDIDQINSLYFERPYFLTPAGESNKAYRLLAEVMEQQHQAGIATFVMRDKEYLVAILSERGILRAETLRFQEEVRTPEDVGLKNTESADKERVAELVKEIEKLKEPKLKPSFLENDYAQRLEKLLEQKRKHHQDTVKVEEEEPEEEREVDLMAVLKRSLEAGAQPSQAKRTRTPAKSAAHRKAAPRRSPAGA
ncbi:MAG TPA: Ku protein [Phycisphaerae bacterium]